MRKRKKDIYNLLIHHDYEKVHGFCSNDGHDYLCVGFVFF